MAVAERLAGLVDTGPVELAAVDVGAVVVLEGISVEGDVVLVGDHGVLGGHLEDSHSLDSLVVVVRALG